MEVRKLYTVIEGFSGVVIRIIEKWTRVYDYNSDFKSIV